MVTLVFAIYHEAFPFIKKYHLKKDNHYKKFQVYKNEIIQIIISGTGKINSAIATTTILQNTEVGFNDKVINIGICGSNLQSHPIGKLFLIHKITDFHSTKHYFPEVIIEHKFNENQVFTFDSPVLTSGQLDESLDTLVDMEASGFFSSAKLFIGNENIFIFKIISDHLTCFKFTSEMIYQLMEPSIVQLESFFETKIHKEENILFSEDEFQIIKNFSIQFHITETQFHQIHYLLKCYKVRTKNKIDFLNNYNQIIQIKDDRNKFLKKLFQEIKSML